MSNNFIKSSPLDGLQNKLTSSSSIISFESILTNSRLLDKLDLSNDDEFLLLQQMDKENEIFNNNTNAKFSTANTSTSGKVDGRMGQPNRRVPSYNNRNQGLNSERLISMPASQFPSLRGGSISNNNHNKLLPSNSFENTTGRCNNDTSTISIKNILNDVTFKDKTLQSKVEQHYSNTTRFSYIVEEDTDSVNNRIIENFSNNETNPFLRRNQNLSTKSSTSTNTQFSKVSLQISTPITQATTQSDSLNFSTEGSSTSSSSSSPLNDKKPSPTFSKSHKKKNSLTSLKNLFKSNKGKNSSDSSGKKNGSTETLSSDGTDGLTSSAHSITFSNGSNNTVHRKKSSSKLIFSPQPNLYPTHISSNMTSINNGHNQHDNHNHLNHNFNHSHHFQSNDIVSIINNSTCNNSNLLKHNRKHSHSNTKNDTVLPDPSQLLNKNKNVPVRPVHQRSHSAFNSSTTSGSTTPPVVSTLAEPTSSSNPSSTTNLAAIYYHPHPSKAHQTMAPIPARNNTYSSHSRNKSLQEEDLISTAIDMRKAGNLHASALRLRQACQKGNKTAFLLYGLALRYGYGIDSDYIQSFYYIKLSTSIKSWDNEVFNLNINPFQLERTLSESIPTKLEEPLVPALYECGIAYLKGFGSPQIDESKGLKCLEKAASMGHVDSMCLSGIIWSQDQDTDKITIHPGCDYEHTPRRKDVVKAAAWFRIAEKRGANLIGSDWIYKKKYLKAAEAR